MPVGTATHDMSWCGCRDMAGNGYEWTRNFVNGDTVSSPSLPARAAGIELRGQPYDAEQPLNFRIWRRRIVARGSATIEIPG